MAAELMKVGKVKAGGIEYPRITLTNILARIGLSIGDEVRVKVEDGSIVIEPYHKK